MTLPLLLLFLVGGGLLILGAELLVRGASRLAVAGGISPLVVGLTVVAFGTSSPELAVTTRAALAGQADMALGAIVGSNVFNILVILGLSATIAPPLFVAQQLIRLDVPILIATSLATIGMALDGAIGRVDGLVLLTGIVAYTGFLLWSSRRETEGVRTEYTAAFGFAGGSARAVIANLGFTVVGLALLVIGAQWLVDAAVAVAEALGVTRLVIGLTIVAFGTSLPEVATSVLASLRGERDIAVGNAVGSSLFNLLAVLGFGAIVAPGGIPVPTGALTFDLPVMTAAAVAALPILFTGYSILRWEGVVLLGYYVAYTVYLLLEATEHDYLEGFQAAMLWFVIPLTVLTLLIALARERRRR